MEVQVFSRAPFSILNYSYKLFYARVAELVDALASGASESNLMEVQVFSCAPTKVFTNELPFCCRKIMEVVAFSHARAQVFSCAPKQREIIWQ